MSGARGMMVSTRKASATLTAARDASDRSDASAFFYLLLEYRRPAAGGARWAIDGLDEVRIGRGAERHSERDGAALSIAIPDERMSTRHGRLARLADGWAFEDLGSKNGSRVGGSAVKRAALSDGDVLELGETAFLFRQESGSGGDLAEAPSLAPGLATLCPAVAAEHLRIAAIADSDVPVLLLGETGTGKELAAQALHGLSGRKGRFVPVNCGALPEALIEAELFGHRQGAFSGSTESRPGLVRSADGGTLFLDEIGDLALASQAALLRVLQEKEVRPVGETTAIPVDVRVVAATHHDLGALCAEGRFRSDLLARLEGYSARLLPLRERRADLGVLIAALLARHAPERAVAFHAQAGRALCAHGWPHNIRELEQVLKAAVALARDDVVVAAHLPERLREPAPATAPAPASARAKSVPADPASLSPEDATLRERLVALFAEHQGNINAVARSLGKDRTQIRRWIARFGLDPKAPR